VSGPIAIRRETTEVSVEKTVAEIHKLLGESGAQAITVDLDNSAPIGISFRIQTEFGLMTFRMPARIRNVSKIREVERKRRVRDQAKFDNQSARIAWRNIKEWIEAHLTMIQIGQVSLIEAFLPYAQDASGKTLYESLVERRFAGLLTDKENK
jgi:hypothetical protein